MKGVPLHQRIYARLRDDISSKRIGIGHRLPTESDLCERFNVSRITVRHALDRLKNDGLIIRAPRRGTVVRSKVPDRGAGWRVDSLHDIAKFGQHASLKVLSYRPADFSDDDAAVLGAGHGYRLDGLRCVRRRPVAFTYILLAQRVGELLRLDDFRSNTVFTVIADRLGIQISEVNERVAACAADEAILRHLRCADGAPLLSIRRVYFDERRKPVELARSWYLSEEFSLEHKIRVLDQ